MHHHHQCQQKLQRRKWGWSWHMVIMTEVNISGLLYVVKSAPYQVADSESSNDVKFVLVKIWQGSSKLTPPIIDSF